MKLAILEKIVISIVIGVFLNVVFSLKTINGLNKRVEILEEKLNSECSPWDPRCKENIQDFKGCKHD